MFKSAKYLFTAGVFCSLALLQIQTVLAASADHIRAEVESRISASEQLEGSQIEVIVEDRLVVLSGKVRLYEHKLVSERLAWTTPGVFEVDNELSVVPRTPINDTAIERNIRDIVSNHERFRVAGVIAKVDEGRVRLQGSFLRYSDPTVLKHRIAEIEGVVEINISARFLSRLKNSSEIAAID